MNERFTEIVCNATGARDILEIEEIQSLWSGYGKIARYGLRGGAIPSIVAKLIRIPTDSNHPRGWNTDLSHQRKIRSYEVEIEWYARWSEQCDAATRIPKCIASDTRGNETLIVLEDLDAAGFPIRKTSVDIDELNACLSWLARFHATFLNETPTGLWKQGTYWHLDTRPDELEALDDTALKAVAKEIDRELDSATFKTFVHGDAKLANFCFSKCGNRVAAVDFQYVGGGCGMKDVAYFIGSCLDERECERMEDALLDSYFRFLREALAARDKQGDCEQLESEWRRLYPYAWTDFHRFLKGWSPGHWKLNRYSERLANEVIGKLTR